MKNHFVIVGAQRSGTTYLYNLLDEHPEICMAKPVKPEPKYFINKEKKNLDYDDYIKTYFKSCNLKTIILGEKSTSYYERKVSAALIYSILPESKIIFILRNPVERALSNYFFSVNNGLEKRSLEEVFIKKKVIKNTNIENISVDPFNYLGRGDYSKFIKIYLEHFKDSQIKVIIFEEFVNNKNKIQNLYSFLCVDNQYIPENLNKIVNPSGRINNIPIEIKNKLKEYYKQPIINLEKLLKLELSIWK